MARRAALADAVLTSTRDAILDAAERRFAGRGFEGVSVREIAADAGLKNQASLYHYFRNKRALYEAALARGAGAIVEIVAASERGLRRGDVCAREASIAWYLDAVLDYLVEHPHLAPLIQRAGIDESKYVRSAVPRLLEPLYAQGVRVLREAGGPWQPSEVPHLAAGLYHLIFGYFASAPLLQAVLGEDPRGPAAVARQRRFLKTAVARLLGVEPARRTAHIVRS